MLPAQRAADSTASINRQLVLGVADALFELPAVRARLAAIDALELRLRLLELPPRTLVVDLRREHRVVDERDRTVELHLEEPGAGRELLEVARVPVQVDARRPRLQRRDQRGVPSEDADVSRRSRDDDHLRLALVSGPVRRDERDVALLPVGH